MSLQHLSFVEMAEIKEENVDFTESLNKLSALTLLVLGPSFDSSASDGIHIAKVYDV